MVDGFGGFFEDEGLRLRWRFSFGVEGDFAFVFTFSFLHLGGRRKWVACKPVFVALEMRGIREAEIVLITPIGVPSIKRSSITIRKFPLLWTPCRLGGGNRPLPLA
jgi:hypothetical protein